MAIDLSKPVARVVATRHWGALVVTITRDGIEYRRKGRRVRYLVPHGRAFQLGAELFARETTRQKKEARKARAAARRRGEL